MAKLLRNFKIRTLTYYLLAASLCSCSTTLVIQSEPSEAEVMIATTNQEKAVSIGKTPLEIDESELSEKLKISPAEIQFIEMYIKKLDYQEARVLMPSSRWGVGKKLIKIELKPLKANSSMASKLVQHLFNAQKFTQNLQFQDAHRELSKALELQPQFARAMAIKATVFYLEKKYDQSIEWYKKALEINPETPDAVKMINHIQKNKMGGA